MADHLTKEKRSWNMSRIRATNTKPEMVVRSLLHSMGYRFRLHGKVNKKLYKSGILPGKPDIVLAKYRTVIFIHGCFWHRHQNCKKTSTPKTRTEWWQTKFDRNIANDTKHQQKLKELGWKVIVIWECEVDEYRKQTKDNRLKTSDNIKLIEKLKKELYNLTYYTYLHELPAEQMVAENLSKYKT